MTRFLKNLCWLALLGLSAQSVWAFALGGPIGNGPDSYQVATLSYRSPFDLTAPKNIGEEYRRTTPVLYYSFDANFWEYFGPQGVQAVDQAYAVFNALTNVSLYSSDLSEFPTKAEQVNYTAQSLLLADLKSYTMGLMTEQLRLAPPVRWVWCLRDRYILPGGSCTAGDVVYSVIKRNFGITTSSLNDYQYSSYVNDTLYTYQISEYCAGTPWLADAVEFPVDPLANIYTAVADFVGDGPNASSYAGLLEGYYYTGLTRDDVAGLRYLLRTNNYNIESTGPGTFQFVTNYTTQQLLTTFSLAQLQADGLTNDDATLAGLYPGLQFSSPATFEYTNVGVPNVVGYFTNSPFDPAGTPPHIPVLTTNGWNTNIVQIYSHQYANIAILTNLSSPKSVELLVVTKILFNPLAPAGSTGTTNTQVYPFLSPVPSGEFYIIPTNACDIRIVRNQLTTVTAVTNPVLSFTFGTTNTSGTSTTLVSQTSQSIVTYVTNHTFVINPVSCPADTIDRRQGIEKITFVRRDYDSLLNQFFMPITNDYTMVALTNSSLVTQQIRRVITEPDFLFTAADLASGPGDPNAANAVSRNLNFNQTNALNGLAGPGTIETPTVFTYDKVGPIYTVGPGLGVFLQELNQIPILLWGSFDGTTNSPIVYPNGTSIAELENMLLMNVTTTVLADASVGAPYSAQLAGTGGTSPYTWSLNSNPPGALPQGGLPPGLTLSADGVISGTPAAGSGGTFPVSSVTYDFTIRMTDTYGRFVDAPVSLTVQR